MEVFQQDSITNYDQVPAKLAALKVVPTFYIQKYHISILGAYLFIHINRTSIYQEICTTDN